MSHTIDWVSENNRRLFLTILRAGGSDIKVPDSLSGEDLLPDAQAADFSLCRHVGKG